MGAVGAGTYIALATAAATTATTAYAAHQASKGPQMPNLASPVPQLPNTAATSAAMQQGQRLAQSAAGTIFSDPSQNKQPGIIGQPATTGTKSLLGQ